MTNDNKGIVFLVVLIDLIVTLGFVGITIAVEGSVLFDILLLIYILIIVGSIVIINRLPKVYVLADITIILLIAFGVLYLFFHGMILKKLHDRIKENNIQEQENLLAGVEHYELEFVPHDMNAPNGESYDRVIERFSSPQMISIGDLKTIFPFEDAKHNPISISYEEVGLPNDTNVYALASVYDNYTWEDRQFVYDKLIVSDNDIDIKTHFEIIDNDTGDVGTIKIVVVSIIPVELPDH